jgi:acetoacetate decarboxylase
MFEDLTDSIISGREELGFPKLFSDIDVQRQEQSYSATTRWRDTVWGEITLTGLEEQKDKPTKNLESIDQGLLVHRYMPSVGKDAKGTPGAEYAVFVDLVEESQIVPTKIKRVLKATQGDIQIVEKGWKELPTLHHIVSRLAEIPVYDVIEAKVVEGEGVMDMSTARRID